MPIITHGYSSAINDFLRALERQADRRIQVGQINVATGLRETERKSRALQSLRPRINVRIPEETPEQEQQRELEQIRERGKVYQERQTQAQEEISRRMADTWVRREFDYTSYEDFKTDAAALGVDEVTFAADLRQQQLLQGFLNEQMELIGKGQSAHSPMQIEQLKTKINERNELLSNATGMVQKANQSLELQPVLEEIDQEIHDILKSPANLTRKKTAADIVGESYGGDLADITKNPDDRGIPVFLNRYGEPEPFIRSKGKQQGGFDVGDAMDTYEKMTASETSPLYDPQSPYFGMKAHEFTAQKRRESFATEAGDKIEVFERRMIYGPPLTPEEQKEYAVARDEVARYGGNRNGNGEAAPQGPKADAVEMPKDRGKLKDGQIYWAKDAMSGQKIYFKYNAADNTVIPIP